MESSLAQSLLLLPSASGVYLFSDSENKIIYVGKAINLKNRVGSYFQKHSPDDLKLNLLVPEIKKIETIEVVSEIEALILEAELIRKHQPKYNSIAKDDKSYLYIKIPQKDKIPVVETCRRQKEEKGIKLFGPFPSGSTVRSVLKTLRRIFPFCSHARAPKKACLYVHLGLCPGIHQRLISKEKYRENIKNLISFLNGKRPRLIKGLKKRMTVLAKNLQFEEAGFIKKQIEELEYITLSIRSPQEYLKHPRLLEDLRQETLRELKTALALNTLPVRMECFDISNIGGKLATGSMVTFENAQPQKSAYRRFKIKRDEKADDVSMIKEVLQRRFKNDWPWPDLLVIDGGAPQLHTAQNVLKEFNLSIPVIGLAKKFEEIYTVQGEILRLPKTSKALNLLRQIRDEAHRFAISYHKHLHRKAFFNN